MATKLFLLLAFFAAGITASVARQQNLGNHGNILTISNAMKEEIELVKDDNAALREKVAAQEQKIGILEDQLSHFRANADVDTLFLATIGAETLAIADNEVIEWDTELINQGGHFSTVTGAYTVPYDGYYQFTISKRGNENTSSSWLLVDQDRYCVNYVSTSGGAPTSTVTTNIQLTAGQIVRVENNDSTVIYGTASGGHIQSWFTGYMLYAL